MNHTDTLMAITCLDGTSLDERIIKVGIDPGFKQGRQFGRGMSGGQVRRVTCVVAKEGLERPPRTTSICQPCPSHVHHVMQSREIK